MEALGVPLGSRRKRRTRTFRSAPGARGRSRASHTRGPADDRRNRCHGRRPSVRVGIESGLVVLGPLGAGSRIEYGATGDAVNTAARLQAAAPPGAVLVGAATQRQIAPLFEWAPPQELELKGKARPFVPYRVVGVRAEPGRLRGSRESRRHSSAAIVSSPRLAVP
ncbi:MAG TPA: adenylate/guanylate cyclase domain-containing protein [Beijerinckiaceae bacterium]